MVSVQGHPSQPQAICTDVPLLSPEREGTPHRTFLRAAELLTSACGTPSGGRHCSRTSCSSGTSLPSGSWSKFFRRSGRERRTQGLAAHCRNRATCKALVGREHHLGPRVGKPLWHSTAGAEHVLGGRGQRSIFPGWIWDSTWSSRMTPFLLHALASLYPLLSFPFGAKPQLSHCFFNPPVAFTLWTLHQDPSLLKGFAQQLGSHVGAEVNPHISELRGLAGGPG